MSQLSLRVLLFFKEKEVGGWKKKAHWGYLLNKSCSTHKGFFGGQNWRTLLKDYVKSFLAVCASLCWLHILCSPHRVVMPTQLPLSQRNITVSYDRRARERKRGGETFSKLSGNATHAFPASLVKRPTARKPINSQRFELRGTCFLQKLIRERMIGEGGG